MPLYTIFLSLALLMGMILATSASAAKKVSLSKKEISVYKGESKTIKVKNTTKKVTWKILSGKKYITLKKKGNTAVMIKGRKNGDAKVPASIGKKKLLKVLKGKYYNDLGAKWKNGRLTKLCISDIQEKPKNIKVKLKMPKFAKLTELYFADDGVSSLDLSASSHIDGLSGIYYDDNVTVIYNDEFE